MKRALQRVMVVDDDLELLEAARTQLGGSFDVLTEPDGRKVLPRVRAEKPSLVILDQWLEHGVMGHELANAIKAEDPQVLVVLWSAGLRANELLFFRRHCRADHIDRKNVPFTALIRRTTGELDLDEPDWNASVSVAELQCELALYMVARCGGNKTKAARRLNVDRSTLVRWLAGDGKR